MSKKSSIKVKPVISYLPPAYPSHEDPEPKAWLQKNSYPFRFGVAGGVAAGALGLLGLGAAGAALAGETATATAADKIPELCDACTSREAKVGKGYCRGCRKDSGSPSFSRCKECAAASKTCRMCGKSLAADQGHAFCMSKAGFPIMPNHYGTGVPAKLSEQDARPIVEKLFKASGLELNADVDPKLEGVSVELDGWDAKRKIGFEFVQWADWENSWNKKLDKSKGVSMADITRLEDLAGQKKAYVATINYKKYPYGRNMVYSDPRVQAKYKEMRLAKGDAEKQKTIQAEIKKISDELVAKGKQVALEKLEADVRGYLGWLKKQGAL